MPLGVGVNLLSNIFVGIVNGFITFPVSVISFNLEYSEVQILILVHVL